MFSISKDISFFSYGKLIINFIKLIKVVLALSILFFISSFKKENRVHSFVNGLFFELIIFIRYSFIFIDIYFFNSGFVLFEIVDNISKKLSSIKLKLFFSFSNFFIIKSMILLSFIHLIKSFLTLSFFVLIIFTKIKTIISLIIKEYFPFIS